MILKENQEIGSDCSDDEFVSALLIEDIGEEECCWALVVEQVWRDNVYYNRVLTVALSTRC